MATTFHLVRHASYGALGQVLAGRAEGWALDEAGLDEAERLARGLAGRRLDAVVSSPIERARQTAAPVARACGLEVAIESGMAEIDFGEWTGRAFVELHADPLWRAWNMHRGVSPIPGGETMALAQARALAALTALRDRWPDGELVVVSHADVIKGVLASLLGSPLDLMHRMAIDPASRSVVRLFREEAQVLAINLPPGA